jgi:hypothetical protein
MNMKDWVVEGPRTIEPESVISANKYNKETVELPDTLYSKLDNKKWDSFERGDMRRLGQWE